MKKILIILFSIIALQLNAATYYCAPSGGSDGNAGTNIAAPWATWQHAFDVANAGDTVYFRGGVWSPSNYATLDPTLSHGHTGTYSNPICFFNYPGESPIFDGTNITNGLTILIDHTSYIKFRGITVRNNHQEGGETVVGWYPANGGNYYFENCVSHDNGGHGWQAMIYDTLVYINCDSYNNYDPNTDGNTSDGFAGGSGGTENDTLKYTYFYGCRAWNNSDDGIDLGTTKQTYVYNCWSFLNGYEELGPLSEGTGIKTGPSNTRMPTKRVVQNCISAFNKGDAFGHNNLEDDYYGPVQTWTNNIAYKCMYGWYFSGGGASTMRHVVMNNNIVYAMRSYFAINFMFPNLNFVTQRTNNATMTQNYPFYTTNVSVTDVDFVLTDSIIGVAQMSSARKVDGSLPDITFLKLASTSDLIDAGTDVGLSYNGSAPDIGYAEYGDTDTTALVVFTTSAYPSINYATISVNVYDDGGDAVTVRGICWGTSANPTTANDTTINGSGTGTFVGRIEPLLTNTTYHVRGYAINQWGVGYGEDLVFTTLSISGKIAVAIGGVNLYNKITGKQIFMNAGSLSQTILVTEITVSGTGGATTISTDGGTLQMIAVALPADATNKTITWSVINGSGSASISAGGLLTALTDGNVTVRATANDASGIYDDQSISISNQVIVTSINVAGAGGATVITTDDGTLQMYADVAPNNASDTTITWSVTNGTGSATISSSGLLTAYTNGIVTPRATANDGSGIYGTVQVTLSNQSAATQIIANHTIVDRYDDIPQRWIDSVKKKWVTYPGESHSEDMRSGMLALETAYPAFAVSSVLSGTPEAYTTSNLRYSRATWGDLGTATGWIYDYGEEDWFDYESGGSYHYAPDAVARTEAGLLYIKNNGPALYATGFGWCWDYNDGINADFYLQATQAYIDYCTAQSISTKIFFTTGPDGSGGILPPVYNYNLYLRSQQIRTYVAANPTRILFDFQDILSYNDAGQVNTEVYDGHTYPVYNTSNDGGEGQIHMGTVGAIRLAKAMWWMLARMAGWDGN